MDEEISIVYIVDDDTQLLKYLRKLVKSVGLQARTFSSADEFLEYEMPELTCCLVLDVRMPGISGFDLYETLMEKRINVPVIFLTAHADVPMSVRAMKSGAVDFLQKPFDDQALLDAIHHALEKGRALHGEKMDADNNKERFDTLTMREREVFHLVTEGLLNKQIASELGISEKTVKIHRGRVMRKMGAQSLAHLVKMSQKVGTRGNRT